MTIFALYEPRDPTAAAEAVPEKFSWFAFLLPPVYAIAHGMWLALVGFLGLCVLIGFVGALAGETAAFFSYLVLAILIGFEAPALRAVTLRRKGFAHRADLVAAGPDLAELAWLERNSAP